MRVSVRSATFVPHGGNDIENWIQTWVSKTEVSWNGTKHSENEHVTSALATNKIGHKTHA